MNVNVNVNVYVRGEGVTHRYVSSAIRLSEMMRTEGIKETGVVVSTAGGRKEVTTERDSTQVSTSWFFSLFSLTSLRT